MNLSPLQPDCIYASPYFLPTCCLSETLAKILPTEIPPDFVSKSSKP